MPVWLYTTLCVLLVGLGVLMALGTLLSTSRHPHWLIRLWDFPRVQIAVGVVVIGAAFWAFCHDGALWSWAFLLLMAVVLVWQGLWVYRYTPLAPKEVEAARGRAETHPEAFRMVASNVLETNDRYDRWRAVVEEADPDVVGDERALSELLHHPVDAGELIRFEADQRVRDTQQLPLLVGCVLLALSLLLQPVLRGPL